VQEQPREGNGEQRERYQPPNNRGSARQHRQPGDGHATTTDTGGPPLFRQASQNLAAAAMLLRGCPEAATSDERRVCQQLKALLRRRWHSKRKALLQASIRSVSEQEHHPRMARTRPLPASGPRGRGRGRGVSGQEPARA
jgi:hypothetical protein